MKRPTDKYNDTGPRTVRCSSMTPATPCQEAAKRVAVPASVKVVVYPGALHAFDVPELRVKMKYGFATIGYDPEAAASARKEVEEFLRAAR